MSIQMATKEQVEAVATREQVKAMAEQVEELITTVDTLAYNTKARFCNKKRTDKGTALLSLKDKDGVLVDINQPGQLRGITRYGRISYPQSTTNIHNQRPISTINDQIANIHHGTWTRYPDQCVWQRMETLPVVGPNGRLR
jgi:hypothetical protein